MNREFFRSRTPTSRARIGTRRGRSCKPSERNRLDTIGDRRTPVSCLASSMKITLRFLPILLVAAAFCASPGAGNLRADDGHSGGGDVNGNETFDVELAMTRSAAAAANSSVRLRIEAEDEHGATQTGLK